MCGRGHAATIPYVVRPDGDGPLLLVVMNHGFSLNRRERRFFPLVEFKDAAMWFARRGQGIAAQTFDQAVASDAHVAVRDDRQSTPERPTLFRSGRAATSPQTASLNRRCIQMPARPCGQLECRYP